MASESELKSMVDEMERMLRDAQAAQAAARRRTFLGSVALLIVVLGFTWAGYQRLRDNFAQERMQAAVEARIQALMPQLEAPTNAIIRDVGPYYMEMGRERLQRVTPRFEARVHEEADKLGHELEVKLNAQLDAFFARLSKNAADELGKAFPGLATDGGAAATKKLSEALALEAAKLEQDAQKLYDDKAQKIRETLTKFPVPDVSKASTEDVNRQLLHDLLLLADHEMTGKSHAGGTGTVKVEAAK